MRKTREQKNAYPADYISRRLIPPTNYTRIYWISIFLPTGWLLFGTTTLKRPCSSEALTPSWSMLTGKVKLLWNSPEVLSDIQSFGLDSFFTSVPTLFPSTSCFLFSCSSLASSTLALCDSWWLSASVMERDFSRRPLMKSVCGSVNSMFSFDLSWNPGSSPSRMYVDSVSRTSKFGFQWFFYFPWLKFSRSKEIIRCLGIS